MIPKKTHYGASGYLYESKEEVHEFLPGLANSTFLELPSTRSFKLIALLLLGVDAAAIFVSAGVWSKIR